jgi:hypothetical protein
MDCLCSNFCDYDGPNPECLQESDIRARKNHICCECNRTIKRGEIYERIRGKWDGEWAEFKTCLGCARLRSAICNCFFGSLAEDVMECFGVDIKVRTKGTQID